MPWKLASAVPLVLHSAFTDPYINLAIEDYLLRHSARPILYLYKNSRCIVLGRNQNPYAEINDAYFNTLPIIRRFSGGGCVFHDLGNLNYSYITKRSDFSRSFASSILRSALSKFFRIEFTTTQFHDVFLEDRKVSGSAYRLILERAYHHGTLLWNAKIHDIDQILGSKLQIKNSIAMPSRKSKVINITDKFDAKLDEFLPVYLQTFFPNGYEEQHLHNLQNQEIKDSIHLMQSDNWTFGKTPPFHISIGNQDIYIQDGKLNGDYLHKPLFNK